MTKLSDKAYEHFSERHAKRTSDQWDNNTGVKRALAAMDREASERLNDLYTAEGIMFRALVAWDEADSSAKLTEAMNNMRSFLKLED